MQAQVPERTRMRASSAPELTPDERSMREIKIKDAARDGLCVERREDVGGPAAGAGEFGLQPPLDLKCPTGILRAARGHEDESLRS